jgi:hypothetical protein
MSANRYAAASALAITTGTDPSSAVSGGARTEYVSV